MHFRNVNQSKKMVIPDNVKTISSGIFRNCINLEYVHIKGPIEIMIKTFFGCYKLKDVILPPTIKYLGPDVFAYCKNIVSINLPDSIYHWDDGVFAMCSNLKHVKLSNNMTYIPIRAFHNCSSLETLVIPSSVTEIGKGAFRNCTILKTLLMISSNKKFRFIGDNAFYGCQFFKYA